MVVLYAAVNQSVSMASAKCIVLNVVEVKFANITNISIFVPNVMVVICVFMERESMTVNYAEVNRSASMENIDAFVKNAKAFLFAPTTKRNIDVLNARVHQFVSIIEGALFVKIVRVQ
jgi:hypothetical protein